MFKMRQQRVEKFIVSNENNVGVTGRKGSVCLNLVVSADQTLSSCSSSRRTSRTCLWLLPLFRQSLRSQRKKVACLILSTCTESIGFLTKKTLLCILLCPTSLCLSGGGESGRGGREEEEKAGVRPHLRIAMGKSHERQRGADSHHEALHARTGPHSLRTASVQELQQVQAGYISPLFLQLAVHLTVSQKRTIIRHISPYLFCGTGRHDCYVPHQGLHLLADCVRFGITKNTYLLNMKAAQDGSIMIQHVPKNALRPSLFSGREWMKGRRQLMTQLDLFCRPDRLI